MPSTNCTFNKFIMNNSPDDLYVLDISGLYYVLPGNFFPLETPLGPFIKFSIITDNYNNNELYPVPTDNVPTYIENLGALIFRTQRECEEAITKYGSGKNLIISYLNGEYGTLFGYSKTMINMSKTDYYTIDGNDVVRLPRCPDNVKQELLVRANINAEKLHDEDLFLIYSHIEGNLQTNDVNLKKFSARWIQKFKRDESDPIFLEEQNIFVFNNREAADNFISHYNGKLTNYYGDIADKANRSEFNEEIKKIESEVKNDKTAIAKTAMIVAGSGVLGAVVKWALDWLIKSPTEVTKGNVVGVGVKAFTTMSPILAKVKALTSGVAVATAISPVMCIIGGIALAIGVTGYLFCTPARNFVKEYLIEPIIDVGRDIKALFCGISEGISNFFFSLSF